MTAVGGVVEGDGYNAAMTSRRLWRKINFTLNVMCVVLVAGLTMLYMRQAHSWDEVRYSVSDTTAFHVNSHYGGLEFIVFDWTPGKGNPRFYWNSYPIGYLKDGVIWWPDWGHIPGSNVRIIAFPLWFLILMFAIKPMWSFVAWYRRRRRIPGHIYCKHCGYDLHAITSDACPECGAAISRD